MGIKGISSKNFEDLTGKRFGRLTVVKRVSEIGEPVEWLCKCDCGNTKVVKKRNLICGSTRSCGCLLNESRRTRNLKHGYSRTRLYAVWNSMVNRCTNEKQVNYSRYGGRGIKVCDEWKNDFLAFRAWAMENGYDADAPRGKCTIDRIDVDGNYEPSNCRWVDMSAQWANSRSKAPKPRQKAVIRVDEFGNETRFNSILEAAKALGDIRKRTGIGNCCRGESHSAYGYKWRFA